MHIDGAAGDGAVPQEDPYFRLRLPEAEKEFIRREADRNCRSMTAQILYVLRQWRTANSEKKTADEREASPAV
jgi:hypothetical protein